MGLHPCYLSCESKKASYCLRNTLGSFLSSPGGMGLAALTPAVVGLPDFSGGSPKAAEQSSAVLGC